MTTIPLFSEAIQAGFPSPAQGYMEDSVSINELLIRHPAATFLMVSPDDNMAGHGVRRGCWLVVDRNLKPRNEDIVIAELEGQYRVRKLLPRVKPRLVASEGEAVMLDDRPVVIVGVVSSWLLPLHHDSDGLSRFSSSKSE